ncbi:MAG: hypothetical protein VX320_03375 [Candidatus Thermoplasmatota archaeon]|nr:hypothetical protein [Candidatus Thermoplasmatota archaeon]
MVERFLEADDPVLEAVLEWTVVRDAADVQQLMEWLPEASTQRDKVALLRRAQALMNELDGALHQLAEMQ